MKMIKYRKLNVTVYEFRYVLGRLLEASKHYWKLKIIRIGSKEDGLERVLALIRVV